MPDLEEDNVEEEEEEEVAQAPGKAGNGDEPSRAEAEARETLISKSSPTPSPPPPPPPLLPTHGDGSRNPNNGHGVPNPNNGNRVPNPNGHGTTNPNGGGGGGVRKSDLADALGHIHTHFSQAHRSAKEVSDMLGSRSIAGHRQTAATATATTGIALPILRRGILGFFQGGFTGIYLRIYQQPFIIEPFKRW
jgi:hypothetical protein